MQSNEVALIYNDRLYTYGEVWDNSYFFSLWVNKHCRHNENIGIVLENCPQSVFSLYGITMAGRVCVPLDADIHERNLKYIIDDCEINTIITSSKYLKKISDNIKQSFNNIILIDEENHHLFYDNLLIDNQDKSQNNLVDFGEHQTAFILYTTGTTGPQKGVELSHFNLMEATKNINEFMQLKPGIIESLPMRLSHSFGFARLRSIFSIGGAAIIENGFLRPERVIYNIKKHRANAISSVPAGFSILLDYYGKYFNEIGYQIEYIEIGSSHMRMSHKEELLKICPHAKICMHYGLTEASRATFIDFRAERDKLHTIGKASPNVEIKLLEDETGNSRSGEILVKGNMVAKAYYKKPVQTQITFNNGWVRTGDMGSMDDEGYISLIGRKKDMINIGGLKVAPGEIEEVLNSFPGIKESAVIGEKTNNLNNEQIIAFIIADNDVKLDKIKDFCIANLESYKVPEEIRIIDKLPKTNSGKIQKQLLKNNKNETYTNE